MVENYIGRYAFVAGATAHFDNAPCLKPDHGDYIANNAILVVLGVSAKSGIADIRLKCIACLFS